MWMHKWYQRFKRYLQQANQRILSRRVLHTVISWQFLNPKASPAVRLHRHVFLQAWQQLPRPVYAIIVGYSLLTWFMFWGWFHLWQCRKRPALPIQKTTFQITKDLLRLTFAEGIPPACYYQYALYRYPAKQWLDFIYTHELPHWHRGFNSENAHADMKLLNDKQQFAKHIIKHKLPAIETQRYIPQGSTLDSASLFKQTALFIKPNNGNAGRDCWQLQYQATSDTYTLSNHPQSNDHYHSQKEIQSILQQQTAKQAQLIQPLLTNHPEIGRLIDSSELMVIRVITIKTHEQISSIYATLEIPFQHHLNQWIFIPIACKSGELLTPQHSPLMASKAYQQKRQAILKRNKAQPFSFWSEVNVLCCKAHAVFPTMSSIAWDVAILPEGVVLLEGNINWAVASHQIIIGKPALEGALLEFYSERG